MEIQVTYRGGSYPHAPHHLNNPLTLQVPPGSTAADIIALLEIPDHAVWFAALCGRRIPDDHILSNGDQLTIYAPVGGG